MFQVVSELSSEMGDEVNDNARRDAMLEALARQNEALQAMMTQITLEVF